MSDCSSRRYLRKSPLKQKYFKLNEVLIIDIDKQSFCNFIMVRLQREEVSKMKTISQKKSIELGELYRELRVARGLKLKDVAKDNLSISQLSKFENGQTMLSADRLLLAIEGIHMDFAEFGHALNDYAADISVKISKDIEVLYAEQDVDGLKNLLNKYRDYETYDIYNHLNLMVIKDAIYSLDPSFQVAKKEIDQLTKYLYDIEEWTGYELYIFGNTVALLSDQDLIFLGKALVERNSYYCSIIGYSIKYKTTLLNLIGIMVERNLFYYVNFFIAALEEVINFQDLLLMASLKFLKLVLAYKQGEVQELSEIESYLKSLAVIGDERLVDTLRLQLIQLESK